MYIIYFTFYFSVTQIGCLSVKRHCLAPKRIHSITVVLYSSLCGKGLPSHVASISPWERQMFILAKAYLVICTGIQYPRNSHGHGLHSRPQHWYNHLLDKDSEPQPLRLLTTPLVCRFITNTETGQCKQYKSDRWVRCAIVCCFGSWSWLPFVTAVLKSSVSYPKWDNLISKWGQVLRQKYRGKSLSR